MLAISPETRPHWMIEKVARAIASVAGPLPLAAANKGKNSEDPLVEQQFLSDPQTYRAFLSWLRPWSRLLTSAESRRQAASCDGTCDPQGKDLSLCEARKMLIEFWRRD